MTAVEQVLATPGARGLVAVVLRPRDPALGGATVALGVSDGEVGTPATGDFAGVVFRNLIASDGSASFVESLTDGAQLTGQSALTVTEFTVAADDATAARWPTLQWNSAVAEVYLGAKYGLDGSRLSIEGFDLFFEGVVDRVEPIGAKRFRVTIKDPGLLFDKRISDTNYRGFGGAFAIRTQTYGARLRFDAAGDFVDFGNVLNKGATDSFEFDLVPTSTVLGTNKALLTKRTTASTQGLSARFASDNTIVLLIGDGTTSVSVSVAGAAYLAGGEPRLSFAVDRASQVLRIYADGELLVTSASIAGVGSLSNAVNLRLGSFGDFGGAQVFDGDLDDLRIYPFILTDEERRNRMHRELTEAEAAQCDLYAKFNEGSGSTAGDSSGGGKDGTVTGATWVGNSDVWLRADHASNHESNGPLTLFFVGTIVEFGAGGTVLLQSGDATDMNYGLRLTADGRLEFGSRSERVSVNFAVQHGDVLYYGVSVDGKTVTFYAALNDAEVLQYGTQTLTAPIGRGTTGDLRIGSVEKRADFDVWGAGILTEALDLEEHQALAAGPITDALERDEVLENWRFAEGVPLGAGPEIAFGDKAAINFEQGGSGIPAWLASYEGDDPDLFPGSPAGKSKARTYGPAYNVALVPVDTQRSIYAWDYVTADSIAQLRQGGVPMVPTASVTATASGQLVFDAATQTITIAASIGNWRRLIPGQKNPARLGQRIIVAGTASNNGVWQVAVDGISVDGLVLAVAKTSLAALQDESGPAGASVTSREPQYVDDLEHSAIQALVDIEGELTADVVGRVPAFAVDTLVGPRALWSEHVEALTGATPDISAVVFNPVIGFHVEPGSALTVNEALSTMARSAFGSCLKDRVGPGYTLRNFLPPTGGGPAVGPENAVSVEKEGEWPNPFWRFGVGYRRIWHTQDGDALGLSVSRADRQRWRGPHTVEDAKNRAVLGAFPAATEHGDFETWLVEVPDVLFFKKLASAMIGVQRRAWQVTFPSLGMLSTGPGDELTLSWDDPTYQLAETPVRVLSRTVDLSAYTLGLTVHT